MGLDSAGLRAADWHHHSFAVHGPHAAGAGVGDRLRVAGPDSGADVRHAGACALDADDSAAFIVFTLYMVPDPATTPLKPWRQAVFGFSVAMVYGIIQVLHLVFGLFFALLTVCAIRGLSLHLYYAFKSPDRAPAEHAESAPAVPARGVPAP